MSLQISQLLPGGDRMYTQDDWLETHCPSAPPYVKVKSALCPMNGLNS